MNIYHGGTEDKQQYVIPSVAACQFPWIPELSHI